MRSVCTRLGTEFGVALESMVRRTPGAFAGVISDEEGDAIDYAHDPERIDGLEVQLLGAQLGLPLFRLHRSADARGIDDPLVLLETRTHNLLASPIANAFLVAMLLDRRANLGVAMTAFRTGLDALRPLLA